MEQKTSNPKKKDKKMAIFLCFVISLIHYKEITDNISDIYHNGPTLNNIAYIATMLVFFAVIYPTVKFRNAFIILATFPLILLKWMYVDNMKFIETPPLFFIILLISLILHFIFAYTKRITTSIPTTHKGKVTNTND